MMLQDYLREHSLSAEAFGNMIGVSRIIVGNWTVGCSVSRRHHMEWIVRVTDGAVYAQSFYGEDDRILVPGTGEQ